MKRKSKMVIIWIIIILLTLSATTLGIYYYYFSPKVKVTPINKEVFINNKELSKKFLPKNLNISIKELSLESSTSFNEEELTNLFIVAINENSTLKNSITGVKVDIDKSLVNLYIHFNYKKIPLEAKLMFSAKAEEGKGIFHYECGKVGFKDISKDIIFEDTQDTSVVHFDKINGDAILSFPFIDHLDIQSLSPESNSLKISFKGTLKFWEWLNKF